MYAEEGLDAEEEIETYYREQAFHKEMAEKYGVPQMIIPKAVTEESEEPAEESAGKTTAKETEKQ